MRPRESAFMIASVLVVAVAVGACSGQGGLPHAIVTAASASPRQEPCNLQYSGWRNGPVREATRELAAEMAATRAALQASDQADIAAALRSAMPTAVALAAQPMPRCTDMRGIYAELVELVYLAGQNAHSAKGPVALDRAAATLVSGVKIERELTAEITRSIGASSCPAASGRPEPPWPPC
jgi:hypothetical protein